MSHPVNTEILENLYEEILDDLTAKNIQLGIMLPMEHLEAIAKNTQSKDLRICANKQSGTGAPHTGEISTIILT